MTIYEIIIAVVQFCTLLALFLTLRLSRNEYRTRTRPYIGFDEVRMKDVGKVDEIEFDVFVRNVGQIPAKNADLHGEFVVDDREVTRFECETKGAIFPTPGPVPVWLVGMREMEEGDRDAILKGTKSLQLRMTVDYSGSGKEKYKTYSTRMYDANRQGWVNEEGNWQ